MKREAPRACRGTRAVVPGFPGARSGTETEPAMGSAGAGPAPGGCPVPLTLRADWAQTRGCLYLPRPRPPWCAEG